MNVYKSVLLCLSLIFFSSIFISCGNNAESKSTEEEITGIPVEVGFVARGDISAVFSTTANLEAEEEANVVAKVAGIIKKIYVEEGDVLKKGQPLAQLDDEQLIFKRNEVRANLRKLENEYERNEKLFKENLISEDAFDKVRFEYESQKASLDLVQLEVNYATIRAPISGVVSERLVKVGNMINQNEVTFKITQFRSLNAILHVPERQMGKLQKGQQVNLKVDALAVKTFSGYIERISPIVDPNSGTIKVTVRMKDPQLQLKPGMFGRINIVYDIHNATLLIPKEAVITEDQESYVYVVRDTLVFRQIVETGFTNATHLEIVDGLVDGDTVVTIGQASLKDSAKIQIIADTTINL
jgi:membrane fusion protein (multidrug efflux system)